MGKDARVVRKKFKEQGAKASVDGRLDTEMVRLTWSSAIPGSFAIFCMFCIYCRSLHLIALWKLEVLLAGHLLGIITSKAFRIRAFHVSISSHFLIRLLSIDDNEFS